jgi:hypothetical protein
MLQFEGKKGVLGCDGLSRRDFLRVGALGAGAMGLSLADLQAQGSPGREVSCILLFLVGGPSHLDTWDLKPAAPLEVRGPFNPIRTRIPGIHISEHFPRMATLADRFALVRSVHHQEAPIHETGQQLLQTGRLSRPGEAFPHYGSVLSHQFGPRKGMPPFVVLPARMGNTGVSVSHGQEAGTLGHQHEPFVIEGNPAQDDALVAAVDQAQRSYEQERGEPGFTSLFRSEVKKAFALERENQTLRHSYGLNTFGQSCLLARRLVEQGVRLVTVNMFDTVFNDITWDCHADGGALPTRLEDYRDILCPMFDRAYSSLLEDLHSRGLLDTTLVLAMGEFGRTPYLNPRGGRDHWPGCWTVLFAGGGVQGGQVVGSSDRIGAEPIDRPVTPAEVAASVYHALGIDPRTRLPGREGASFPVCEAAPVAELFRS